MREDNNDYSPFLFLIAMMLFVLSISQCSTTEELRNITHELRMLQYK